MNTLAEYVPGWDEYFLDMCDMVATRSKDPRTKVGSVIVGPNKEVRSTGYNGFPRGIVEIDERWTSPEKYKFVIHAEANAILNAARNGVGLEGCHLYVQIIPCPACCLKILQAGITHVTYCAVRMATYHSDWLTPETDNLIRTLFHEGRVTLEGYERK